ncbi:hypothetical protein Q1695_001428 [Nippostrongylus brasiliensis]|nr:hypothetical protein Q1695_001428 [Nippostrongylus brasiliensis]
MHRLLRPTNQSEVYIEDRHITITTVGIASLQANNKLKCAFQLFATHRFVEKITVECVQFITEEGTRRIRKERLPTPCSITPSEASFQLPYPSVKVVCFTDFKRFSIPKICDSSAYCVLTNFVVELRGCAMNSVSILSLQQFLRHLLHNLNRPVFVQSLKRFNLTNQTAIQADLLELFKP